MNVVVRRDSLATESGTHFSKGIGMNQKIGSGISRRSAVRRILGLAAGVPLVLSGVNDIAPIHADWLGAHTMRVEEDWYVQIGTPSPQEDSPQITTVLSPSWSLNGNFAVFDMNCATQPNFESGGVQLQLWQDDEIAQSRSNANWTSLCHPNDEIRYTSVMSIQDGKMIFEIQNGSSTTWGAFGDGELKLQVPTWRPHLNHYSRWNSESNSRIGLASHRVRQFVLERVRFYSSDSLLREDNTSHVLHNYDPVS